MEYCWLSTRPLPPPEWDLRDHGWLLNCEFSKSAGRQAGGWPAVWMTLRAQSPIDQAPLLVDMRPHSRPPLPQNRSIRQRALLLAVERSPERANWIEQGFGDAIALRISKSELSARLKRINRHQACTPGVRQVGPLTLDMFHRDAHKEGQWLALHPREFALLWRLADTGGLPLSRAVLLADIWRMEHDPGTNRVEVHVARLRRKLEAAGCGGLIVTDPAGGYRIALDFKAHMRLCEREESLTR